MKKIVLFFTLLMCISCSNSNKKNEEMLESNSKLSMYNGYVLTSKSSFKGNDGMEYTFTLKHDSLDDVVCVYGIPKSVYEQYGLNDTINIQIKEKVQNNYLEEDDVISINGKRYKIFEINGQKEAIETSDIVKIEEESYAIIEINGKKEAIKLN